MPTITIKIKTWTCSECGYYQDFEPTAELMVLHFKGVPADVCPACFLGKNPSRTKAVVQLLKETRPENKSTVTIIGEEEIETEIEEELAEPGKRGIDISTEAKKNAYRVKRQSDIQEAITKARELEDN